MYLRTVLGSKKTAQLGMLGPMIGLGCIFLSIALTPEFSWTEHALSNLGIWDYGVVFNTGLMITGVFCGIFVFGLFLNTGREMLVRKIGYLVLTLAGVTLFGVGAFTMADATYDIHLFFSFSFFILTILAYLLLGLGMLRDPEFRILGVLAIVFSIAGALGWYVYWDDPAWAIPEAITAFPTAVWLFILAKIYYDKYDNMKIIIEPMKDDR